MNDGVLLVTSHGWHRERDFAKAAGPKAEGGRAVVARDLLLACAPRALSPSLFWDSPAQPPRRSTPVTPPARIRRTGALAIPPSIAPSTECETAWCAPASRAGAGRHRRGQCPVPKRREASPTIPARRRSLHSLRRPAAQVLFSARGASLTVRAFGRRFSCRSSRGRTTAKGPRRLPRLGTGDRPTSSPTASKAFAPGRRRRGRSRARTRSAAKGAGSVPPARTLW